MRVCHNFHLQGIHRHTIYISCKYFMKWFIYCFLSCYPKWDFCAYHGNLFSEPVERHTNLDIVRLYFHLQEDLHWQTKNCPGEYPLLSASFRFVPNQSNRGEGNRATTSNRPNQNRMGGIDSSPKTAWRTWGGRAPDPKRKQTITKGQEEKDHCQRSITPNGNRHHNLNQGHSW